MTRKLIYVGQNTVFALALMAAIAYDLKPLANLVVFATWVLLVLTLLYLALLSVAAISVMRPDFQGPWTENPISDPTSMPNWVDVTYDLAILTAMIGAGWFVTASAYLIHSVALQIIKRTVRLINTKRWAAIEEALKV